MAIRRTILSIPALRSSKTASYSAVSARNRVSSNSRFSADRSESAPDPDWPASTSSPMTSCRVIALATFVRPEKIDPRREAELHVYIGQPEIRIEQQDTSARAGEDM